MEFSGKSWIFLKNLENHGKQIGNSMKINKNGLKCIVIFEKFSVSRTSTLFHPFSNNILTIDYFSSKCLENGLKYSGKSWKIETKNLENVRNIMENGLKNHGKKFLPSCSHPVVWDDIKQRICVYCTLRI